MTHDILQTDIEFARGLISGNRPDDEIAKALKLRGVAPTAASQLVQDLRCGRAVMPQRTETQWITLRKGRRRSSTSISRSNGPDVIKAGPVGSGKAKQRHHSAPQRDRTRLVWLAVAACLGLVALAGVLIYRKQKGLENETIPNRPAKTTENGANHALGLGAGSVALASMVEVRADGLFLGGEALTRESALATVARVLGPASRTNHIEGGNQMVYAYDRHGILLYSEGNSGTDSLLVDFEGHGGNHGAKSPFRGAVQIQSRAVRSDTRPEQLISIDELGLRGRKADEGVFTSSYNGLELIFSYLNSTQNLSMVEISLK